MAYFLNQFIADSYFISSSLTSFSFFIGNLNPFTFSFGQKPTEFISRTNQIGKIIHTFDMENPSNKVYMVAGVRGSGKTVSLAEIADHYSSNDQWIVLRLSADTDLIAGAVSELTRVSQFHDLDLGLNLNLGIAELSVNKTNDSLEKEAMLRNILEKLKNKGKKVLFIIDEINRGEISKILGELFFSMDPGYRGKSGEVATQYSNMHTDPNEKFYIPENVYIIGTMNDIDRSVDSFDFAMRRRFRFVEVRAEDTQDMLESLEDEELKTEAIARMDKLNAEIIRVADLNENYQIGASYFLKLKVLGFDDLWTDYLQPLLQDYVRGLNDEEECMRRFAKAYGYTASGEGDSDEAAIN